MFCLSPMVAPINLLLLPIGCGQGLGERAAVAWARAVAVRVSKQTV